MFTARPTNFVIYFCNEWLWASFAGIQKNAVVCKIRSPGLKFLVAITHRPRSFVWTISILNFDISALVVSITILYFTDKEEKENAL